MFKKTLSVVIPQRMHQCSGKMQDWWSKGSWFDPGLMQFYCVFIFLFLLFFCSFFFFFFFDKKDRKQRNTYVTWQYVIVKNAGSVTLTIAWTIPNEFHFIVSLYNHYLSHVMRKPVYAICKQQRRRSACASAQSDQRLYCCIISLVSISEISSP